MREQRHILVRLVGVDHQVDGHVLIGEVAAGISLHVAVAFEEERRFLCKCRLVGLAHYLEVGSQL